MLFLEDPLRGHYWFIFRSQNHIQNIILYDIMIFFDHGIHPFLVLCCFFKKDRLSRPHNQSMALVYCFLLEHHTFLYLELFHEPKMVFFFMRSSHEVIPQVFEALPCHGLLVYALLQHLKLLIYWSPQRQELHAPLHDPRLHGSSQTF